jgi:hypothetical protein
MVTRSKSPKRRRKSQSLAFRNEDKVWQTVWKKRREALLQAINDQAVFLQTFERDMSQIQTLRIVAKRLHKFGQQQFDYLYKGLSTKVLVSSETYPDEFIYSATLNQISYDLEVVERAADQRLNGTEMMRRRLCDADRLALKALQDARVYLPPFEDRSQSTTTVVTYFQKMASIRLIPYADVALIGIPYTAVEEPFDLLAIPHEVGHYLFWHGRDPESHKSLRHEMKQKLRPSGVPAWCKAWLEEAFADVFATLVAGPATAYALMGVALRNPKDEFVTSDGDHVVPLIRPQVAFKTLKHCEERVPVWGPWADTLMGHWQEHVMLRNDPKNFRVDDKSRIDANSAVHVDPAQTAGPVDALVSYVLKYLPEVTLGNWNPDASLGDTDSLYTDFEEYFADKDGTNWITNLPVPQPLVSDNFDWNAYIESAFPELQRLLTRRRITEDVWGYIFLGNGWTTGPGEPNWPRVSPSS